MVYKMIRQIVLEITRKIISITLQTKRFRYTVKINNSDFKIVSKDMF